MPFASSQSLSPIDGGLVPTSSGGYGVFISPMERFRLPASLAIMKLLVEMAHLNYLAANAIAIALCALANFLLSDRWVFES